MLGSTLVYINIYIYISLPLWLEGLAEAQGIRQHMSFVQFLCGPLSPRDACWVNLLPDLASFEASRTWTFALYSFSLLFLLKIVKVLWLPRVLVTLDLKLAVLANAGASGHTENQAMVAKQLLRDDSSAAVNLTRIKTNADPVNLDLKLAVLANAGASFQDKTSAVEALSQIARRGDDKVINAITKLLQEGSSAIRYAAICALPKIVQQGHPPTIAALTVSLENDCHQNRGAAIGALAKLVQKGHRPTIDSLMTVLANDGDSSFVRTSAVEALSHIARRGDDKVINAITKLLQEDCSGGCSTSVVEALSELAIRGNDKVINAITKLLQEGGSAIRYAAICALPKIVQQGHPTTIAALTVSLEDDCHQNRGAAIGALAKLVQKGYRPNLCRAAMRSQRCSQSSDDNNTEEDA
jgi:HEAT repeat protein